MTSSERPKTCSALVEFSNEVKRVPIYVIRAGRCCRAVEVPPAGRRTDNRLPRRRAFWPNLGTTPHRSRSALSRCASLSQEISAPREALDDPDFARPAALVRRRSDFEPPLQEPAVIVRLALRT